MALRVAECLLADFQLIRVGLRTDTTVLTGQIEPAIAQLKAGVLLIYPHRGARRVGEEVP